MRCVWLGCVQLRGDQRDLVFDDRSTKYRVDSPHDAARDIGLLSIVW